VIFLLALTLEICGLVEIYFEAGAQGADITTAGDSLWWGYVAATTVGYGDQFPVTPGGRLTGLLMLTVGVALFATFSGFLANAFLLRKRSAPGVSTDSSVEEALAELDRLTEEQQRAAAALGTRLDQLEARA